MDNTVTRIICLIAIIILGYLVKRSYTLPIETVSVLSKIILKITLPATIVCSYAGESFDLSILAVVAIGFLSNIFYLCPVLLLAQKQTREETAFDIVNTPGYNVGIFALPLIQSIYGASGIVVASLFDTGCSIISLGGSYSLAAVIKGNKSLSLRNIGLNLLSSIPFMTYIVMLSLSIARISLSSIIINFANILADANVFLGMLMIGMAFHLDFEKRKIYRIIKALTIRYTIAAVIATLCWYVLPFQLVIKQIIVILLFCPTAASSVAWTGALDGDTGTASALGSISILCSVTIIFILLSVFRV